jgi:nickel-dependent lactate racemase
MALYFSAGSECTEFSDEQLSEALANALRKLGERRRVLLVPPDASRFHSRAGELTQMAYGIYGERVKAVLPALGTHTAMTEAALTRMFGDMPRDLFRVHRWREDVVSLGEVPAAFIREQSEGKLNFAWPAQVNKLLVDGPGDGPFDLILSIGQVVPHEVIGMANYNKNILIGTGGVDGIDRSHYLSGVYGLERIMGRTDTPVRRVLNYAADHFLKHLPIVYVLTVVARRDDGHLVVRGLFIGDDIECFEQASDLARKVNFIALDREIAKAVVYLEPYEFKSTWLGNKAIYRTRMALADNADLVILAPGVKEFGEDPAIDHLIRKYGYFGTPKTLAAVRENADLAGNLGAAAHLMHSSSEGRFRITYCPGELTRAEVESVGFGYGDLAEMMRKYHPETLQEGWNTVDGEDVFYISNPALGLWAHKARLEESAAVTAG